LSGLEQQLLERENEKRSAAAVILFIISVIDFLARLLSLLIIIHVVLTYFMSPFHPIRQWIDRLIEPLLQPIRNIVPSVGMIDFSPLILILFVQIINYVLRSILWTLL
jgi:YggT family protein